MEQKDYLILRDCFFKSYKSFVDYVMITHNTYSMYSILVMKKYTYNNLSKVSVIIRNSMGGEEATNQFSSSVTLTHEEANNLINKIREDFRDCHYIAYSAVNDRTFVQTLQNTKFSLNIKLNDINEYQEAIKFNSKINCDGSRHRVLTKN